MTHDTLSNQMLLLISTNLPGSYYIIQFPAYYRMSMGLFLLSVYTIQH